MGEFIPATCVACKDQYFGTPFRIAVDLDMEEEAKHFCRHESLETDKQILHNELAEKPEWCPLK